MKRTIFNTKGKGLKQPNVDTSKEVVMEPNSSSPRPDPGWTYRICNVPLDMTHDELRDCVGREVTGQENSTSTIVHSLAQEIDGDFCTATVTFRSRPPQLQTASYRPIPLPEASGQPPATMDTGFLGITTLYAPKENHEVDIIAIPGLGGHAFGSFRQKGEKHMWLRDTLPKHNTNARVMIYGYESSLSHNQSFENLEDFATTLHTNLWGLQTNGVFRPIVFIAHSLGGLVVKQTLNNLSKSGTGNDQRLIQAVYGIAFFGVPHDGMDISSFIPVVGDGPSRFLLESIGAVSSQILPILQREFMKALGGEGESEVFCFYETLPSPTAEKDERGEWRMTGPEKVLVTKTSATHCRSWENEAHHICALRCTHSNMVKFRLGDHNYRTVRNRIQHLVEQAIQARRPPQPELSKEEKKEIDDCLKSLSFPMIDHRRNVISRASPNTCEWLLKHKEYTTWTTSDQGLLWIKGKPGSGKSTLLKYALEKQRVAPDVGDSDLFLSFFFHARGDELQKTPFGFFRSLLCQLLEQMPTTLQDLVNTFKQRRRSPEKWQWDPEELWNFIELSLPKVLTTRPVWLFVDAMDECGETNAKDLVEKFRTLLEGLASQPIKSKRCHILFTCRQYPILDGDCKLQICPEHENAKDISVYVQRRLDRSPKLRASTVISSITECANGVFMWARLVVDQALYLDDKGEGIRKITKKIESTPPELNNLYLGLVRNVEEPQIFLKLIQWICFAERPLSPDELRWALIVDANCPYQSLQQCQEDDEYGRDIEKRLKTLSRGLIEITPSSDLPVVQFIHQSVKDFFLTQGLSALVGDSIATGDAVGTAHFQLSRTCIRYLKMDEIGQLTSCAREELLSNFPLLHYATTQWVVHTKQSDSRGISQDDLLQLFDWPLSNNFADLWRYAYQNLEKYSIDCPLDGTTLLHIVSRHGIFKPLPSILRKVDRTPINSKDRDGQAEVDSKDENGQTPLSWAARNGHEAVVELLLNIGQAEVDLEDRFGQTPLIWAARNGHEAVVELLLNIGQAEVDLKDDKFGRTPLSWAAGNGHEAVVELLLNIGQAEVDSKDGDGWTPLSWAARAGHKAVVELLLNIGQAEVDSKDGDGRTPLIWAARNGHEAVVELLLNIGQAEVDSKDGFGRTPLSWAAGNRHKAVVKLLLNIGQAEVDSKDGDGQTPLSWAARAGHKAVVELLLNTGQAEVDSKDGDGWTPLIWAVGNRHKAVVELLKLYGASYS